MKDLFGNEIPLSTKLKSGTYRFNPLIAVYGKTEGKKCKDCSHLYSKEFANKYYKCDLRKDTNGPGTDHRINWNACGKYEKK